jgi:hypothetical protein
MIGMDGWEKREKKPHCAHRNASPRGPNEYEPKAITALISLVCRLGTILREDETLIGEKTNLMGANSKGAGF